MKNIRKAYKLAKKGNRWSESHLIFKENLNENLYNIQQEIMNETYKIGEYYTFPVYEPKLRIISALPFKDRVVQHAIHNIINPIFEKTFYKTSYACRKNKGTHRCMKDSQASIRRMNKEGNVYFLKTDFSKYFNSINPKILIKEIENKIKDFKVIKILKQFIEIKGIKIGNLLSQLFANIYGHIFDRFIKTKLKIKHYFRYMDDTCFLNLKKELLIFLFKKLKIFSRIFLKLRFSKWYINKIENSSLNFVGYRIKANYKLVRKDSIIKMKRRINLFLKKEKFLELKLSLISWKGHIEKANTRNLQIYIKELIYGKFKALYTQSN